MASQRPFGTASIPSMSLPNRSVLTVCQVCVDTMCTAWSTAIAIEKGHAGKRARTWVTLTQAGQTALAKEQVDSVCCVRQRPRY
jgi:hypothetical protein